MKTERAIKNAYLSLLKEKHHQKITVKEIVERAEVGRTTFYSHFRDAIDVLESIEDNLLKLLVLYVGVSSAKDGVADDGECAHTEPFESMVRWFDLCIEHRFAIIALTDRNGDPYFAIRLRNKVCQQLNDMMNDEGVPEDSLRRYFVEMLSSAYCGLMLYAIRLEGDRRLSSRKLAKIINHTRAGYFAEMPDSPISKCEKLLDD
jgi:AcrR family transcriptional regulator